MLACRVDSRCPLAFMTDSPFSDTTPERGRIERPAALTAGAGWTRWLPGLKTLRQVRALLAAARHRRRPRHDDHARAGRHRVRGGIGGPGHQWPLRDHRAVARVRLVRSQPHHRAGPGFGARGRDPRRRAAAVGGRFATRSRGGRHDGHRVRHRLRGGGPGSTRLHHGAALEADPLRLHERHRANGRAEPDPEASGLLSQGGRAVPAGVGNRREGGGGKHEPRGTCGRRQRPRPDPGPEAPAARPGHVARRDRRHCCGRSLRISRHDSASRCSVPCLKGCRCQASRSATSTTSCRS